MATPVKKAPAKKSAPRKKQTPKIKNLHAFVVEGMHVGIITEDINVAREMINSFRSMRTFKNVQDNVLTEQKSLTALREKLDFQIKILQDAITNISAIAKSAMDTKAEVEKFQSSGYQNQTSYIVDEIMRRNNNEYFSMSSDGANVVCQAASKNGSQKK